MIEQRVRLRPTFVGLGVFAAVLFLLAACNTPPIPAAMPTPIPTFTPAPVPPHITVIADGLLGPIGMAALPDGGLLVAEEGTGGRDDSAGVTLITADGAVGRFISGLPSTFDSGDLAGVPLVSLSPDGGTLYVGNFGAGHLWTLLLPPDQLASGFTLPVTPYAPDDMGKAMERLNNVMLVNPYDITFDEAGVPVVTDATGNGVAKETPDGTTHFFHRFDRLPNPVRATDPVEAVPTGIVRVDDEYWVTLLGGCPYPPGSGQLVAIDEERNQRTVLDGLNLPIDVALGPNGEVWVLEFATFTPDGDCFSGKDYQVETGRLSRLNEDGTLETVLDHLNFPGAVLPMPDGSLYISEVLPGRVLHVTFDGDEADVNDGAQPSAAQVEGEARASPTRSISEPRTVIDDHDAALRHVIQAHKLRPNPGVEMREGNTPRANLGQLLFFDPILSGDRNISCATCHHPAFAMADGRVLPIGAGGHGLGPARTFVDEVMLADEASSVRRLAGETDAQSGQTTVHNPFIGQFVPRNSPTIINSALMPAQFWDGRVEGYAEASSARADDVTAVKTLERAVNDMALDDPLAIQAFFPLTSLHEMAGATLGGLAPQTIRTQLLDRLREIPEYVNLFRTAFDGDDESINEAVTLARLADALAAFERRIILTDAPWDRYLHGDASALTDEQKRGALLFYGQINPAVNCATCHAGDLFTDFQYHNLLAPQLGPGKGQGYTGREDWGRAGVSFDARDRYAFRTPSLRNVELTAPYLHDGAFTTLDAVIRHHADIRASALAYDPSANAISPDLYSSLQPVDLAKQWPTADPLLRDGLALVDEEIADLRAFLSSLTDPAALDLRDLEPDSVPSGLPLDPWPEQIPVREQIATPPEVESMPAISTTVESPANAIDTDFQFTDVAADVGIDFRHGAFATGVFADPNAAMSGGLCWIDFDNDGWLDLYLVNNYAGDEEAYWLASGLLPRNALYHNEQGQFVDVSAGSGTDLAMHGNGCLAADFDNDGWTDLHVTIDGPNVLLWNNGDGTFSDGASVAGVDASEWSSAAVAGDLNNDGWLDLFVADFINLDKQIPRPVGAFPQDYYGLPDHLYLNNGDRTFREVAEMAGLTREERGLGALFSDLDADGDLDLYIANDGHPNRLYANQPWPGGVDADPEKLGFRLVDLTMTADVGDSGSGMGIAGGDYDGDGWLDLFITNWERELNALYRNEMGEAPHEDGLTFQYSTFRIGIMGLGNGITGWGTALADFDHDTDADLLIVNGRVPVTNLETDPELARYYRNRTVDGAGKPGRTGHFLDWTAPVGLKEVGALLGRGSAVADYDNDGDLDVAINSIAGQAVLLQNNLNDESAASGHWLIVDLGGMQPGARVTAELPDGRMLVRESRAGSSYLASEDPRLHFGLGPHREVTQLTVTWPNGEQAILNGVASDQILVVSEGE